MEVRSLKPDMAVGHRYVVKFKKPVQRYSKGYRFELRVGDATGEVMLKFWGPDDEEAVSRLYDAIEKDDVVLVKGTTSEYRDNVEISVNDFSGIRVCEPGEYDPEQFVEVAEDIPGMYGELMEYASQVEDAELRKVLDAFFKDDAFIKEFKYATAAMYKHHARIGGLLEHTLSVTKLASGIAAHYPRLNKDIVLTGAILHDLGKVREFDITTNIRTSTQGMLLGHVVMGFEILQQKIRDLDVSPDTALKLKHMILAHHGELEYGSPKRPCFPEAMLVHCADSLDASLTQMIDRKENPGTEDDYVYTKDFGNIYLK
ncbi:MAG: HD domain-containing protein [Candidatus Altiarchaeota archaeon]|nr:HD domain-containing protein [Candidatus Altiarchaeota archaeon]